MQTVVRLLECGLFVLLSNLYGVLSASAVFSLIGYHNSTIVQKEKLLFPGHVNFLKNI